jgi:flagellar hook-associated protein 3 FlgL
MRISTSQQYLQGIESFGNQQSKLAELQKQISSGVKLTKPSDDPAASSRVLELEQTVSLLEQYNVNVTLAENRLKLEETTLNAVENAFFRIKELTIQANGIANDATALKALSVEIEERYQEVLTLANTKDSAGDYLFAGFQNQAQPFVQTSTGAIPHVVFNGDQGQRSFQISQTRQITADDSGSKIFLEVPSTHALRASADNANAGSGSVAPALVFDASVYTPGDYQIVFTAPGTYDVIDLSGPTNIVTAATYSDSGAIEFNGIRTSITGAPAAGDTFNVSQGQYRDIFTTINSIVDTLQDGSTTPAQRGANLAQAQIDMENFFTNVLEVRTSIGGRLNALETQFDDNIAFSVTTKTTISTLRDTDLAEAISQLTLEQTTLDAAQAVFARITSSSLFNYLR